MHISPRELITSKGNSIVVFIWHAASWGHCILLFWLFAKSPLFHFAMTTTTFSTTGKQLKTFQWWGDAYGKTRSGAKMCIFFYIWNSDWWILAPKIKDHRSVKGRLNKFHFPKNIWEFFLMEYLGWKQPLNDHHEEEDRQGRNRFHTYLVKVYYLLLWGESGAYWQWRASGVVAAVSLCHVLKGASAIFFSI